MRIFFNKIQSVAHRQQITKGVKIAKNKGFKYMGNISYYKLAYFEKLVLIDDERIDMIKIIELIKTN